MQRLIIDETHNLGASVKLTLETVEVIGCFIYAYMVFFSC